MKVLAPLNDWAIRAGRGIDSRISLPLVLETARWAGVPPLSAGEAGGRLLFALYPVSFCAHYPVSPHATPPRSYHGFTTSAPDRSPVFRPVSRLSVEGVGNFEVLKPGALSRFDKARWAHSLLSP
jgi:hypothetical protein